MPNAPTPQPRERSELELRSETDSFVGKDQPKLTPQQQFAARLAYCTAGFCAAAITAIFILRIWGMPQMSNPPTEPSQMEAYLKNARELEDIENQKAHSIFEMCVSVTALPLLTTLVGYLIGRASKHSD